MIVETSASLGPKTDFSGIFENEILQTKIEVSEGSSESKTHRIGLSIIIGATIVGILVVGACAASGVGIAAVIAAVVPLTVILALKTGALAGAVVGLVLTPLALYLIKCFILKRNIPNEEMQKLETSFSAELQIPSVEGALPPALGEYSINDGFITEDAAESLEFKLKLIENAEQSIEIMPNYITGKAMTRTLQAIKAQLEKKPNLKVRMVISSMAFVGQTPDEMNQLNILKKDYENRFEFILLTLTPGIDSELRSYDNHMKMFVVDEKYFVFGGSSVMDQFSSKGDVAHELPPNLSLVEQLSEIRFRDHDLVGKGPIAKTMRLVFYKQYASWSYITNKKQKNLENLYFQLNKEEKIAQIADIDDDKRLVHNSEMKLLISTPHYSPLENACTKEYQRIISQARELTVGHSYFDPVLDIRNAFDQALSNGASVKILTNGHEGDSPKQNILGTMVFRINYRHILQKIDQLEAVAVSPNKYNKSKPNVEIFEYNIANVAYHSKVITAKNLKGEEEAILGSYNLSHRSDNSEDEAIISFKSPDLIHQLKDIIDDDATRARKITVERSSSLSEDIMAKFNQILISYI